MSDREKVINDLQMQIEELEERLAIALEGQPEIVRCAHESTTFKPHCIDEYGTHFICGVECGSCHEKISRSYHYCPYCGKALEWEWPD